MKSFFALFVLLCLPPLAVILHDGYFTYANKDPSQFIEQFRFSDTGWLWLTYDRAGFENFRASVGKEQWDSWIEPTMRTPAVIVSAVPLAILLGLEILVRLFSMIGGQVGVGPRLGRGDDFAPSENRDTQKRYKYKRR